MSPRTHRGAPNRWLLSVSADGEEVIASSPSRAVQVRGESARRLLSGEPPEAVLGGREAEELLIEWDAGWLFSDLPFEGVTRTWESCRQLIDMLQASERHTYAFAGQLPGALLEALEAISLVCPMTPVLLYGHRMIVGPTFVPAGSPCTACWSRLVRANVPTLDMRARRGHRLLPPDAARLNSLFSAARALWEVPAPRHPPDQALILRLDSGEIERQRVIPWPGCRCQGATTPGELSDLEGDVFGLIHAVAPPTGSASPLPLLTAMNRLTPSASGAACALEEPVAKRRALAEAAERLAALQGGTSSFIACHRDIGDAPPLSELLPYSKEQYAERGFSYQPLDPAAPISWLRGRSWLTGEPVSVPAQWVTTDPRCRRPELTPLSSTGIAAGPTWVEAMTSALFELVERDVVIRSWYSGEVKLLDAREMAPAEVRRIESAGMRVHLGLCQNPQRIPVAIAFLARGSAAAGGYGFGAGHSVPWAARHAIEEACLVLTHLERRGMLLDEGPQWSKLVHADGAASALMSAELNAIAQAYRPVVFDLTTRESSAVGLRVASVWSPVAVDLPRPGEPLPQARWSPDSTISSRIAGQPIHA